MEHRPLGWERIADCGAMRVVGLRLAAGQRVPEHRNAVPLAVIVTEGTLHYSEGDVTGSARAGELVLINPGERHTYWAEEETTAYMVFAGLPGARPRPWSLRRR
ncbi:MAG TPA: cupin domain-containing protein [Candidatus Dormibacteraeota bacterium]|jgi:quercetin dioxygenase-like cupin family protein|nr:cupin domain-containing protein [Candidatus Dormibacteraeota bacterium]